jgi:hypothetical protein
MGIFSIGAVLLHGILSHLRL